MKEKREEATTIQTRWDSPFVRWLRLRSSQADRVSLMTILLYSLTNSKDNVHQHPPLFYLLGGSKAVIERASNFTDSVQLSVSSCWSGKSSHCAIPLSNTWKNMIITHGLTRAPWHHVSHWNLQLKSNFSQGTSIINKIYISVIYMPTYYNYPWIFILTLKDRLIWNPLMNFSMYKCTFVIEDMWVFLEWEVTLLSLAKKGKIPNWQKTTV